MKHKWEFTFLMYRVLQLSNYLGSKVPVWPFHIPYLTGCPFLLWALDFSPHVYTPYRIVTFQNIRQQKGHNCPSEWVGQWEKGDMAVGWQKVQPQSLLTKVQQELKEPLATGAMQTLSPWLQNAVLLLTSHLNLFICSRIGVTALQAKKSPKVTNLF